ncbi:MAG: LPS-assembly protein LptD [Burkholderiaceae bacterium]|nr:LPS-assembly protein LptD [Burkholderiaceae bacterium]
MPRLPLTALVNRVHSLILLLLGGCLMLSGTAFAQDTAQPSENARRLQLKLERQLDENREATQMGAPTFVRARNIEGSVDERLVLRGEAEIRRGGTVLRGDTITYTHATDTVNVEGQARAFRDGAVFMGPRLEYQVDAQTGKMPDANFFYAPRSGRGEATLIEFFGSERARMENARFTTCGPEDNAWWVQAERIDFDSLDETATARSATLFFKGVPILASPYLSFPTSDRRKSGFLTPSFGLSSTLGSDIRTPYYFNLAPNYDYTLTPRVMTKRGVLVENELRYLDSLQRGTLVYQAIPKDQQFGESRDFSALRYEFASPSGFAAGINYNRASDDRYFVDFGTTIVDTSQKVLPQDGYLAYNQPYWNTAVRVTKNQTLQDPDPLQLVAKPYERVPQVTVNGYVADWKGFEATAGLEGTRFQHPTLEPGNRYIADVRASYPILAPGWFIVPRARLSSTSYDLDPRFRGDTSQTRTLPIASLDTGLIFEREVGWFGRAAQQTLEPRLFYAYIPYRDQSNLPNFDSALADINYAQLFNENIYSGSDRISEANQLTAALTTRILDNETGAERLRASIGQRYYFTEQRVTLPGETPRTNKATDVLASLSAQLGRSWAIDLAAQYAAERSEFVRATAGTRWQPRRASVLSAYYRYQSNGIRQVDLSAQWPLSKNWYAVGRFNYSLEDKRLIDTVAGLEYQQDCWLLRFVVQRFATTALTTTTNFYLQLELNGLTSVGSSAANLLQRNIPGYQLLNPVPREPGRFDYYE